MPDKDKDKRPPPPQALRTFLNLSAAVPPQYGVDPTKPLLRPYVPTRGQVRAQQGLMGLADLVRGLIIGASDEKDSNAAQMGELISAGVPLLGGVKAAKTLANAARVAKTARTAEGVVPPIIGGRALGSLAATLELGDAPGLYNLAEPTVERVGDLYRYGTSLPSTSNWAGSASEELLRAFGGDREAALRWARMWGATSPNTSVPVNTRESVSALIHALENPGVPFTVEMAQNFPEAKITMAPSKVPNLNNALLGNPLSPGTKVEAMAGFMAGEPRIPLDVHALHALGSTANKLDPEYPALRKLMTEAEGLPFRGGLTEVDMYMRYEDALKRALADIAPGRSINQVFAELWEGARAHKGLKPQGGPLDILRKHGLLQAGAMLDPERLRAALRQQGWTAPAIAGLLAALGSSGGAEAGS